MSDAKWTRAARRDAGRCIDCGHPNDYLPHHRCRKCSVRLSNVEARKHHERKLWLIFAAGIGAAYSPLTLVKE
jgi:hypothetical protein